jgi:glycosyltransferase involved in cell wall biosynthesis
MEKSISHDELISVIVPVYNMKPYLNQCLESIGKQTYSNIEIIIIDDGSTDGSGEICDDFAMKDNRCIVIHQQNQGLVMARRKGIETARGKYIGFVDSDDWIEPDMFGYLYEKAMEYDTDVVTSGRIVEGKETKIEEDNIIANIYNPMTDRYFCENMIMGKNKVIWGITPNFWNKLFRKEQIEKWQKKVDTEITYGEDDACVYPCMAFANKVYVSDKCFYHYRIRETSMSNSGDDKYFMRINLLYLKMKEAFEKHPLSEILMKELGIYMVAFVMRGINGLWGLKSGISIPQYWIDMTEFNDGSLILLYGAGVIGKDYYKQLCYLGMKNKIVWVDKNHIELNKIGYPVKSIDTVDVSKIKKAIVSIENVSIMRQVKEMLIDKGIPEKQIYWCRPRKLIGSLVEGEISL